MEDNPVRREIEELDREIAGLEQEEGVLTERLGRVTGRIKVKKELRAYLIKEHPEARSGEVEEPWSILGAIDSVLERAEEPIRATEVHSRVCAQAEVRGERQPALATIRTLLSENSDTWEWELVGAGPSSKWLKIK